MHRWQPLVWLVAGVMLAAAPAWTAWLEQPFYLDLLNRALILALAASGLSFILSYAGLLSLGHAAYLAIGAYCVGIPLHFGVDNGLWHCAFALGAGGGFALLSGALCLRTRGVYFIMTTLAFAQMLYFGLVGIEQFGGDDGLVIHQTSRLPAGIDLSRPNTLYYLSLTALAVTLLLIRWLTRSHFGRVLFAAKHNHRRMQALGYPVYKYQLAAYVFSGMVCALAGVLLGNFTRFISPDLLDWTHSAELIFMVIAGGAATLGGPLLGAGGFVLIEQWFSTLTVYWQIPFGLLLIALVLGRWTARVS